MYYTYECNMERAGRAGWATGEDDRARASAFCSLAFPASEITLIDQFIFQSQSERGGAMQTPPPKDK